MGFLSVIGRIFLWIFIILANLILLLLAFSIPKIRVILKYNGKFSAAVKFLCFTFRFGEKDKKKKEKKAKKESNPKHEKKEKDKKDKKRPSVLSDLTFTDYLNIAKIALTEFVFKIKIEKFNLNAKISGEDAAKTALTYGKINAAAYPIVSFLTEKKALQNAEINIYTDFLSDKSEYQGEIILYSRFISVIITGFLIAVYLLKKMLKTRQKLLS